MRLLLYGDFTWDRLGASYQRAFQQLGHAVIPFDTRGISAYLQPWLRFRIPHRVAARSYRLRAAGCGAWNRKLIETSRACEPDLLLVLNGDLVMPHALREIRQQGAAVFVLHADNPFPSNSTNRPETLPCALESDSYFIWSRSLADRLRQTGVKRVEYLPFAWDPEVFPYDEGSIDDAYDCDVAFVGGWDRERESWLAPLVERFELRIWGPDYWVTRTRPGSPLRRCWQGGAVRGPQAAGVLRRSRIALNLVRCQNPDGTNMRTFELAGCGAFSIATRTVGALEIFPEGGAAAYFSTPSELHDQIERYLTDGQSRYEMACRAHAVASQAHTYVHRAQHVLSVYEEIRGRCSSRLTGGRPLVDTPPAQAARK